VGGAAPTLRVLLRGSCALFSSARSPRSRSAWSTAAAPAARTRTSASCSHRSRATPRRRSPPLVCSPSCRATRHGAVSPFVNLCRARTVYPSSRRWGPPGSPSRWPSSWRPSAAAPAMPSRRRWPCPAPSPSRARTTCPAGHTAATRRTAGAPFPASRMSIVSRPTFV
jgi:hypothetical protein